MRLVLQRVSRAAVTISGTQTRSIGAGLVILLGVGPSDDAAAARALAAKAAQLRIFPNAEGKFDKSLLEVGGEVLVVSQFTLYGDCRKGRRPDFSGAMPPERAEPVYRGFAEELARLGVPVRTGEFGAKMAVELVNDGPVTLWLDSEK